MAQPAAPSDTEEEEEEDTRGPAPGGETGPWTMGTGAALQPALLRGVWHHFPARFGSGSKQPGVQENIPGWVEKGGGMQRPLSISSLSLPGKSVWITHRAEPPVRRVWALGDPEGTGTCCSAGSPVVAASRGGTGLSLCPRPHPAARWQVGNGAASPGTAQPLLHPPSPPYLNAGSGMLSQPPKRPRCFSHRQQVFLLFPRAVSPPGRVRDPWSRRNLIQTNPGALLKPSSLPLSLPPAPLQPARSHRWPHPQQGQDTKNVHF